MVRCLRCNKTFESEWGLKVHTKMVHKTDLAGVEHPLKGRKPYVATLAPQKVSPPPPPQPKRVLTFCPCCGLNLLAVEMALQMPVHEG
jgi:hypothetical protein